MLVIGPSAELKTLTVKPSEVGKAAGQKVPLQDTVFPDLLSAFPVELPPVKQAVSVPKADPIEQAPMGNPARAAASDEPVFEPGNALPFTGRILPTSPFAKPELFIGEGTSEQTAATSKPTEGPPPTVKPTADADPPTLKAPTPAATRPNETERSTATGPLPLRPASVSEGGAGDPHQRQTLARPQATVPTSSSTPVQEAEKSTAPQPLASASKAARDEVDPAPQRSRSISREQSHKPPAANDERPEKSAAPPGLYPSVAAQDVPAPLPVEAAPAIRGQAKNLSTAPAPALAPARLPVQSAKPTSKKTVRVGPDELETTKPIAPPREHLVAEPSRPSVPAFEEPVNFPNVRTDQPSPAASASHGSPTQAQPVAQPAQIPAQPAPIASETRADIRPPVPIADAIEQLVQARENGRAGRPELTLRHQEFGAVNMRIEAIGSDLRATLTSRDPGFAPAIHAALADRGVAAGPDTNSAQSQRGHDQSPTQSNPNHTGSGGQSERGYGSSTGSGQASPQPYREQSGAKHNERASPEHLAHGESASNTASDGGLYA